MAKKKRSNKKVPKPGDPDYLTPTQLRNRRKRRAKKEQKDNKQQSSNATAGSSSESAKHNDGGDARAKKNEATNNKDPSMKYISNPMKAPIVTAARQYFKPILQHQNKDFQVHLGPLYQWRTVSKLAVRPDASSKKPKVAIGLFLPQSHTLLPVPNCRAHHPSINHSVECITRACHDVGVVPYQESDKGDEDEDIDTHQDVDEEVASKPKDGIERGSGQLRYVAINVARETGAAQITLVWNEPPPDDSATKSRESGTKRKYDEEAIGSPVLEKLVSKLLSMSTDNSNSSNTNDVKKVSDSGNDATLLKATDDDEQPTKKKRRRGRREGKATTKDGTGSGADGAGNSAESFNKELSQAASANKQGDKPKLNLHSLWINYNPSWKHSNAIFAFDSSCWKHVYGPHGIVETLTFGKAQKETKSDKRNAQQLLANPKPPNFTIPLNFPPNVFRQANLDAFQNIVGRIRERMLNLHDANDNNINCIELYGGVGTIGLHVSDAVSTLVSSDENPNNSKCFYQSVNALPTSVQSRLVYKQKNAADMISSERALFQKSNSLIVDPPRKGLDIEVVDYLCNEGYQNMKLVVYVSCGFQAFQRDCNALMKSGHWKVEFAEGYLLFPGSDAIETLAFFVPVEK